MSEENRGTDKQKLLENEPNNLIHFSSKNTNQCRTTLWYLAFTGFAINYMFRISLNIAIVDMIQASKSTVNPQTIQSSQCYNNIVIASDLNVNTTGRLNVVPRFSVEREILKYLEIDYNKDGFKWNEYDRALILGCFYWTYWISHLPGGILARKYGTKVVFGVSNMLGCLICALMPIAAYVDMRALILLRVIQGLVVGVVWPSMHNMISQWIPPNERSTFCTAYIGTSVGTSIFYPLFGYIITWTSWEWVFHFCLFIGTIWFCAWQYFVFDSPALHPRIDPREREFIEHSLGATIDHQNKAPVPWISIFTSFPVWANIVALFGTSWGLTIILTQTPTYFSVILGWNLRTAGLLSGLPFIGQTIFALGFSFYVDHLLNANKMSRTNVRKLAVTFCNIFTGISLMAMAYSGCNTFWAVIFFTIALIFKGAMSAGPLPSIIDMSPNFSSVVCGATTTISVLAGILAPYVVGQLTFENQTIEQWKTVFLITAILLIVTGIVYTIFSNSEIQYWNNTTRNRIIDFANSKWIPPIYDHYQELKVKEI